MQMRFEDLDVRKISKQLFNKIEVITNDLDYKHRFFQDQILRATLSISNNIAEGFERETNNELRRFLYIAKGSCGEVRSMLSIALENSYFPKDTIDELNDVCIHISIMLYKYIKNLPQNYKN